MSTILSAVMLAALVSTGGQSQQRPDFSGTWTLPSDAPPGRTGSPAPAPGFGSTITIRHDADSITISRSIGGSTVHVTHRLDGIESRSRTPGRLCEGDWQAVWTAAWDGDALVTTMVGSVPAGAQTTTRMNARTVFRLSSPDRLAVEVTVQNAGTKEPRSVTTIYQKSGPPSAAPAGSPATPLEARLDQIDWLAGTWTGGTGANTIEERWTPRAGGSMLAVARTIRNGVMTGFEFLCIVERNGGLVYQAMPNGRQPATDFVLTRIDASSLTFENPGHDFPKMIRYSLSDDGTLQAVVSGSEKQKPQTFTFRKQE